MTRHRQIWGMLLVLLPSIMPEAVFAAHVQNNQIFGGVSEAARVALLSSTLIVQVRTDMRPFRDFTKIRTRLMTARGTLVHEVSKAVRTGTNWARGVRVAEIDLLRAGSYRFTVAAINRRGRVAFERPVRVDLKKGVRVVTVLLSPPPKQKRSVCDLTFSREKRQCGLDLKICIEKRRVLSGCQNTHKRCLAAAKVRRDNCSSDQSGPLQGGADRPRLQQR